MSYHRDDDIKTRGAGAIAAIDNVSRRGQWKRGRIAQATRQRDRRMAAVAMGSLGMINVADRKTGTWTASPVSVSKVSKPIVSPVGTPTTPTGPANRSGGTWTATPITVIKPPVIRDPARDHRHPEPEQPQDPPKPPPPPPDPPNPTAPEGGGSVVSPPIYGGGGGSIPIPTETLPDPEVTSGPAALSDNVKLALAVGGGVLALFLLTRKR